MFALLSCGICRAQEEGTVETMGRSITVDSLLVGRSIADVLPSCVTVNASSGLKAAFDRILRDNETRFFNGFRVRVYQSSRQNAREASSAAMARFNSLFPEVVVFRDYSSPYFRVMAGNFRTRIEAEVMLSKIKENFPEATVVREKFKFPDF